MNSIPTGFWRPTASWTTLTIRAELLKSIREFFDDAGYLEVETPLLSRETVVDRHLHPVTATLAGPRDTRDGTWYLQTSPEFGMKRLLADLKSTSKANRPQGLVQITKAFRDGEVGRLHNPEFTMIEWYGIGQTYHDQMEFTELLVRHLVHRLGVFEPVLLHNHPGLTLSENRFSRISFDAACERSMGRRLLGRSAQDLMHICREEGLEPPESIDPDDRDTLLNLLLVEKVEPELGRKQPEFLFDYPASQSALAKVSDAEPPTAQRFELYWQGIELCNGYSELTRAEILRQRINDENEKRRQDSAEVLPASEMLLDAMESGLPECSGVALGFDRLVMLLLGKSSLAEVMAFPYDRA